MTARTFECDSGGRESAEVAGAVLARALGGAGNPWLSNAPRSEAARLRAPECAACVLCGGVRTTTRGVGFAAAGAARAGSLGAGAGREVTVTFIP